jgi:hypothetical protein
VASYYFEIADSYTDLYDGKYLCSSHTNDEIISKTGWSMIMVSNRVWKEEDNRITFVKNRNVNIQLDRSQVDLKEFMWIKLCAKQLE